MLENINGISQAAFGTQPHWSMLHAVMLDAAIYVPLQAEITRLVVAAINANSIRPFINSRQNGAEALELIGSAWHAQFARRFPGFPNGAARGVFGMALWYYLAGHPDRWSFVAVADPYGYGQESVNYWRL
jgi:hypothetical protein